MTFSIVARCPKTRALGVGVSTAISAVGSRVPHVEADVGAIATQANTNIDYGVKGLKLLMSGFSPKASLETMLEEDSDRETRQVIMIDSEGRAAAFTGKEAGSWKGHIAGEGFVVAGNMLVGKRVVEAMKEKYLGSKGELAERLLKALEVGDAAGGDKRGKLSAALVVAGGPRVFVDLRVDFSPNPVGELRRVFENLRRRGTR